jgi:hypothetical protein
MDLEVVADHVEVAPVLLELHRLLRLQLVRLACGVSTEEDPAGWPIRSQVIRNDSSIDLSRILSTQHKHCVLCTELHIIRLTSTKIRCHASSARR